MFSFAIYGCLQRTPGITKKNLANGYGMSVAISQFAARQVLLTRFWAFFIHFWSLIACLPFYDVVVDS